MDPSRGDASRDVFDVMKAELERRGVRAVGILRLSFREAVGMACAWNETAGTPDPFLARETIAETK